jgi:putative transposase
LIDQAMAEMATQGDVVTVVQACRWAGVSRRSYYYRPTKAKPRVNEHLAARVKRVNTDLPYAGYRTVAWLLGENKNTIQRLFQIKGWQVRKRRSGARPGCRHYLRWPHARMSAGQQTLHVSGVVRFTAGAP